MLKKILAALTFMLAAVAAVAQTADYERVLFPIVVATPIAGAFGSSWLTDMPVLNRSSQPVRLSGHFVCFVCRGSYEPRLTPGLTYSQLPLPGAYGIPGSFLLVERSAVDDVSFHLRARDVSHGDQNWGSEIPVVREREFSSERIELLSIPADSRYRRTLRIYTLDPAGGRVLVRVFQQSSFAPLGTEEPPPDTLLGEQTFDTVPPPATAAGNYPGFVPVGELPFLSSASSTEPVRVEIVPVTPGLAVWAFVTVTNNVTQELTVISPQ